MAPGYTVGPEGINVASGYTSIRMILDSPCKLLIQRGLERQKTRREAKTSRGRFVQTEKRGKKKESEGRLDLQW